jgi:hypothetical protein
VSKPDIVDRLERVTRKHILGAMPSGQAAELAKEPLIKLLQIYANWRGRFPVPVPRSVHVSEELASALAKSQHARAVRRLKRLIENGEPIDPYLSTRVTTAHVPPSAPAKLKKSKRHLDHLLADWGVHHHHLGEHTHGQFAERTGDLLFAMFADADAYLIGLYAHGAWSDIGIFGGGRP